MCKLVGPYELLFNQLLFTSAHKRISHGTFLSRGGLLHNFCYFRFIALGGSVGAARVITGRDSFCVCILLL